MSHDRRRQRSTRILVASMFLTASAAFVAVAVVTASQGTLIAAAITAVVVGAVAARVVADEVMETRREWFKDRAEQAQAYRDITIDRTRENMEFVEAVNETLSITTKRIAELNGTLRLAEARTEETDAQRKLLQREVEALRGELEEPAPSTMTLWDGADVPTIVDLLSWEATAAARAQAADDAEHVAPADEATLPEAKEA
ncbi:hypothetical protein KV102_04740 [Mumia sp. zg.B53]|uniref:hypothetical protein n=1 Tax=unclassified Mumia TaxID=2621872 RepID=UPI001C6DFF01|nr:MULTISPECIES: hypothetical protein [unclassified Mumia]MBW9204476.1 hypothetical protein [Mumia sp. zg.B17]MBW9214142.1 hypothetical protein [Mumia sp. zg.B53]MDD9348799.1 hypothetical protein [Mumia sp.]